MTDSDTDDATRSGALGPSPLQIDGYRVLVLLGKGGMGEVYLAEDLTLGRQVAIKTIRAGSVAATEARARFLREARLMATIEHPNVARIYSFGQVGDAGYIVMEYVRGETLAERLKREPRLPLADAVELTDGVAAALEAAWEKGIVHRDVKPSNVLIDARGAVRVMDFGLARSYASEEGEPLTEMGSVLGTPHYMSPEQVRGEPLDFRADMYSLGILMYEMLAGQRPFTASTPGGVIAQHLTADLPPLASARPDAPEWIAKVIADLTSKKASDRPSSYGALRGALRARPTGPSTGNTALLRPGLRTSRRAIVAALGTGLIAAVVIGLASRGDRNEARGPTPGPSAPIRGPKIAETRFQGQLVDVDFKNASIDEVLGFFAKVSGLNIIAQPRLVPRGPGEPRVTYKLSQVPWDQALDLILGNLDLDYSIEGNVIRIWRQPAPGSPAANPSP